MLAACVGAGAALGILAGVGTAFSQDAGAVVDAGTVVDAGAPPSDAPPGLAPWASAAYREADLAGGPDEPPVATAWVPPPPIVARGRCWVRYAPLATDDLVSAFEAFQERDRGWYLVSESAGMDRFAGHIRWANPGRTVVGGGPIEPLEVVRRARALARKNADLLGLTPQDFGALVWEISEFDGLLTINATLDEVGKPAPRFPELSRHVRLSFMAGIRDGAFGWMQARVTPEVSMCTQPSLTEAQVRVLPSILGRKLGFYGMAGYVDSGKVGPAGIKKVELRVSVTEGEQALEYRLVYSVTVAAHGGEFPTWTIIVDAENGRELAIIQNFEQ
jgi:hypothetical protein